MRHWLWLFLALAASVSSAGQFVTFAWDVGVGWPIGTTVELCGNGNICQTEITGTHATLDLPLQPGDVIQGMARAVAPSGYQCGNPMHPCPYSEWATVAQTLPMPGNGLWVNYEEKAEMAISYLGYAVVTDADGSMSQSVTVPTNTNYAVIFVGGWVSATVLTVNSMSLDGVAATNLYTRALNDDAQDSYVYGVATSAGSKTFAASFSGGFTEGGIAIIVFLSGVDTASPLVTNGYGYNEQKDGPSQNKTIASIPTAANGIGLVFGTGYIDGGTFYFDVQSQTSIVESSAAYNYDHYGAGYKATTGVATDFGSSQSSGVLSGVYSAIVVVTLNPSAGTVASLVYPSPHSRFSHILIR